jgi:heat shock protein HspQ
MKEPQRVYADFAVGQVIHHKLFNYRGVIVDVDWKFQGSEEWYRKVAHSHPPKDKPWYRVLVHDTTSAAYVAETNLEPDPSGEPVNHPYIPVYFSDFKDGTYINPRFSH